MKEKHIITDKQLNFLDKFLTKKGYVNSENKIELMDHLICDFELNGNGNLSQFLSTKLYFIEQQKSKREKILNKLYLKEMFKEFLTFFSDFKRILVTLFVFLFIFCLTKYFNNKIILASFAISLFIIQLYGVYISFVEKRLRKLEEFKALAAVTYLPSSIIIFSSYIKNPLKYIELFTFFWFLIFILTLSFVLYIKRKKNELIKKYNFLIQ
ncbi:hypothetical protein [uncultured Tenacibaculum sp.]|uniref:hypothetical protein n=1 Tax=uncultured Tenacibaculum sp. TaxID=174713 RepID=UPI00262E27C3|nr:hypothetical protein [uncultured Tenacibaculum sp.]